MISVSQQIERSTKRPRCMAMAIAAQRLSDCLDVRARLQRDRARYGGIACRRVGVAVCLVIRNEDFGGAPIGESADRRDVLHAGDFNLEGLVCSPVRQSMAGGTN